MYGIHGEERGVFFSGVNTSTALWAIVDIYGNTTAMEFVGKYQNVQVFTSVAKAQGKQGIWLSLFPERENTGKISTTQGIFQISLKIRYFIVNCPFID